MKFLEAQGLARSAAGQRRRVEEDDCSPAKRLVEQLDWKAFALAQLDLHDRKLLVPAPRVHVAARLGIYCLGDPRLDSGVQRPFSGTERTGITVPGCGFAATHNACAFARGWTR